MTDRVLRIGSLWLTMQNYIWVLIKLTKLWFQTWNLEWESFIFKTKRLTESQETFSVPELGIVNCDFRIINNRCQLNGPVLENMTPSHYLLLAIGWTWNAITKIARHNSMKNNFFLRFFDEPDLSVKNYIVPLFQLIFAPGIYTQKKNNRGKNTFHILIN